MSLLARAVAEAIGTAALVAVVVGSGIMASILTSDVAVVLLLNQLATILALGVLIALLIPLSGAHFNPAVTLALVISGKSPWREAPGYILAQLVGALAGTALAHAMFERSLVAVSANERLGVGTFIGEVVATLGLVASVLLLVHREKLAWIPLVIPAWIGAAYFFTSSTSFANPAVTLGRMFTDSFSGVAPLSGLGFVAAQLIGMGIALVLVRLSATASEEATR